MVKCSSICIWCSFPLGWIVNIIGMRVSSRHHTPVLFWTTAFAPMIIPLCVYGIIILVPTFKKILHKVRLRTNANATQATAAVAAVEEEHHTLQSEPREPPNTDNARSFDIATLPMYLYSKDAVEGGLACPICKDLFDKTDAIVQLPFCLHSYHKECIEAWLQRKLTCPVCRCRVDMEIPRDIALIIDS